MEKDSGQYCYEPYPTASKQNTLKREPSKRKKGDDIESCKCFGMLYNRAVASTQIIICRC